MESKDSGFYAFEADGWKALGFEGCMLTEPMRQRDGSFVGMLNRARVADPSCLRYFNSLAGEKAFQARIRCASSGRTGRQTTSTQRGFRSSRSPAKESGVEISEAMRPVLEERLGELVRSSPEAFEALCLMRDIAFACKPEKESMGQWLAEFEKRGFTPLQSKQ